MQYMIIKTNTITKAVHYKGVPESVGLKGGDP